MTGAEMRGSPNLTPARMLELAYCPRLFYLEHIAEEWEDSADTVEGRRVHRRVDRTSSPLPEADELPAEHVHARSVTVASEAEGVVAKVDLIDHGHLHGTPFQAAPGQPARRESRETLALFAPCLHFASEPHPRAQIRGSIEVRLYRPRVLQGFPGILGLRPEAQLKHHDLDGTADRDPASSGSDPRLN